MYDLKKLLQLSPMPAKTVKASTKPEDLGLPAPLATPGGEQEH